ncbi:MAG: type IX secretion system membrane protein PorP/SprF [Saprospiraceae bacterium]|nr:type IX secretion system membrane protein PorP/SprF [Saprospiraceae bacterium]MCF8250313.1 type IX secretion system membrane protein PorP/SprF [Saprospiraceae bacterium]MCF8280962.1 type IX secretion system membrane protein PorP/SprF [Bacteroidales bacterium]MCF8312055.1 type IX secretion system membrane protein PorP/SprF [Saprospiraceae bacterium]MCF8440462.1 type IX secretion system membrane protein PorP/SprF [Saprospiraceae bacterium]
MKNIITTIIFCFLGIAMLQAQQQPHNTQFMYYKLGYNPGFAGSQDAPCVTCIYRQQWLGLDGAPSMAIATFNMPLNNQRVGIGANLYRHTIGITTMYNADLAYSYRVRLGRGMLGLGIQGSLRSMEQDFAKTNATQPKEQDGSIPGASSSKFLFNFGTGLYYNSDKFYVGLSAPRLLENNIDFTDSDIIISREVQHFYFMGGVTFPLNENLALKPQALLKHASKAPVDFDANVSLLVQNRYVVGVTYRLGGNKENGNGESIDVLVGAQLTPSLMFTFSYDYTLSDIKGYSNGSIEASIRYCIGKANDGGKEYDNPRFF